MKFAKYENNVKDLLIRADKVALFYKSKQIKLIHILIVLLNTDEFILLSKNKVNKRKLIQYLFNFIKKEDENKEYKFSMGVVNLLNISEIIAGVFFREKIRLVHIILGLINSECSNREVRVSMTSFGLSEEFVVELLLNSNKINKKLKSEKNKELSDDLNIINIGKKEEDLLIFRDDDKNKIEESLLKKTKNNIIIVGPEGVGKRILISGIAKDWSNKMYSRFYNNNIYLLDLFAILTDSKTKEQVKHILDKTIYELKKKNKKIFIYIMNLEDLVTTINLSLFETKSLLNILLEYTSIQLIGVVSDEVYRRIFEINNYVKSYFTFLFIKEHNQKESYNILLNKKKMYEYYHGVDIHNEALVFAVKLSAKYLKKQYLPEKAIGIIDEAAVTTRTEVEENPDILNKSMYRLNIMKNLAKEREDIDEYHILKEEIFYEDLMIVWQAKYTLLKNAKDIKKILFEQNIYGKDKYIYNYLQNLNRIRKSEENVLIKIKEKKPVIKYKVDKDVIAKIIAKNTGIPMSRMLKSEKEKLLKMEIFMNEYIIGQGYAVKSVANAVRRSKAGLQDPERPIGSFLFLGPTGVGKTELVKVLNNFLFDGVNSMLRLDMSEFMEKHTVARLLGSPPGYKGSEDGGQLSEFVKNNPYCIVLFDEIEKAHLDVLNILLQILDDGRLTDSKGVLIDFNNVIIIMTSNVGGSHLLDSILENGEVSKIAESNSLKELKSVFRPEFLNRVDDLIMFNGLNKLDLRKITAIQVRKIITLLQEKGIILNLNDDIIKRIVDLGYDPSFGARPIRRTIKKVLQDPISMKLLDGSLNDGDEIDVVLDKNSKENNIVLNKK